MKPTDAPTAIKCKCDRIGFKKVEGIWRQVCTKCGVDVKGMPIGCPSCGDLVVHAVSEPEKQYVIVPFMYETVIMGRRVLIDSDGENIRIYENGEIKSDKPAIYPLPHEAY